jgi:hypothetical protein
MSEFSIRMKDEKGIAPPSSLFAPRPDKKGPKTIAILLVLGALAMGLTSFGDIQMSFADDLSQDELDTLLTNVRDNGENITDEEYQDFHDAAREDGAYALRGWTVMVGAILIILGGVMLFKLNIHGPKFALVGSGIAAAGGLYANWMIFQLSEEMLPPALILANKILGYLCGFCMVICGCMAALPLFNASARMALEPRITLANEEE